MHLLMPERHIRKAWNTKKGKTGFGLSGFGTFCQLLKSGFDLAGAHQTMTAFMPEWMIGPLFIPLIFVSGVLLILWAIYEPSGKDENRADPLMHQETKGERSPASATSGPHSPITNIGKVEINLPPKSKEPKSQEAVRLPLKVTHIPFATRKLFGTERPKIEFVRTETINIKLGGNEDGESYWHNSSDSDARLSGVVHLRNKVGGVSASNVKAQILFYGSDGHEIFSKLGCCWLDNKTDLVDFKVGDTLCLIVAITLDNGTCLPWFRRVPCNDGWSGEMLLPEADQTTEHVTLIEVNLIGENDELLFNARLDYSIADGKPKLVKRPR